jgi:hypothetical protein
MSVVGSLANTLAAGKSLGGDVVLQAFYVAIMAAGGWTWLKRMIGVATVKGPAATP